ncbi:hypothetical protein [Rugamonas rubra]|uniref:hypothetical protein n=1 Tax=Rugamonas rubra TaxID=758825 RepID=UPI001113E090|nr:hypothetical protein [Rugamonas rubra]
MMTSHDAQLIFLEHANRDVARAGGDWIVIQSCELSPRGDYWVLRGNCEAYVVHGIQERCLVGASAHLVEVATGTVKSVGSWQSWQEYLQNKYDVEDANGSHYLLSPTFDKSDKAALINLRQKLGCRFQDVLFMTSLDGRCWLSGTLRALNHAKWLLKQEAIDTAIELDASSGGAIEISDRCWHWALLKTELLRRTIQPPGANSR